MRVALTFDDGPAEATGAVLDALAKRGAKATFFVCGWATVGKEALLTRMMAEGHQVGNHTWTHARVSRLTPREIEAELWSTSEAIRAAIGEWPTRWRAPHFDTSKTANEIGLNMGMKHTACTIDPGDWAEPDAARIAQRVLDRIEPGSIVDLHDGLPPDGVLGTKTRQPTVQALELILQLDAEFVTVAGL